MATSSVLPQRPLGAAYPIALPNFEGPLDLLLHLIETRMLDISAVSLMAVTDQYLQALSRLEEVEPGALADFLVVASRLVYIKSYHLLPKPRPPLEDDEDEASGDALVRQLIEYRRFKAVAAGLRSREEQGLRVYVRTAPHPELARKLDLSNVDVAHLHHALRKVLSRLPAETPLPRVKTYAITVAEQIVNVRSLLHAALPDIGTERGLSFTALLSRSATRLEVIVTFLAVLELYKLHEVDVVQHGTFGEIYLLAAPGGALPPAPQPPE